MKGKDILEGGWYVITMPVIGVKMNRVCQVVAKQPGGEIIVQYPERTKPCTMTEWEKLLPAEKIALGHVVVMRQRTVRGAAFVKVSEPHTLADKVGNP